MIIRVLSLAIIFILINGCQKTSSTINKNEEDMLRNQLEDADKKISIYLDILDDEKKAKEEKTRMLCKDYPELYETQYMPALLKLSPNEYTQEYLKADFKKVTDYYKKKLLIQCD